MTLLAYTFNNGIYLNNSESTKKPLYYKETVLESLDNEVNYFIPNGNEPFDKEGFARKNVTLKPTGYVLKELGKLKKEISVEDYGKLTNYYASLYKKSVQKEVFSFEKAQVENVLSFDMDFESYNDVYLSSQQELIKKELSQSKMPNLLFGLTPKGIQHLFPRVMTGTSIYNLLVTFLTDIRGVTSKGSISIYYNSIDVRIYEHEYRGEMKRREIMKSNGRPYATRKYTYVKDLPNTKETRSYTPDMFKDLSEDNEKDLILKVEKLLNAVVNELK